MGPKSEQTKFSLFLNPDEERLTSYLQGKTLTIRIFYKKPIYKELYVEASKY